MDLTQRIKDANRGLEKISIREKDGKLYVRGRTRDSFPPKPSGEQPDRAEIAMGVSATASGLKVAIAKAKAIDADLIWGKFDWTPHLKGKQKPPETVAEWVRRYEEHHWLMTPCTTHDERLSKENSYHKNYRLMFNRLPQNAPLTTELLEQTAVNEVAAGTRSRQVMCMAFRRLAEFAKIDAGNLKQLGKGYTPDSVDPRNLPSDQEIQELRLKLTDPAWRWVFDVMAIYGLRPHEVFRLRTDRLVERPSILEVQKTTKTGFRVVYPIPADGWGFDAKAVLFPRIKIEGRSNNQMGMAISQKFRQQNLGIDPYDLRHCYARRGFERGFGSKFLSKSMGHSVRVHEKTYQAWIREETYTKMYNQVMGMS
ncbi:hypothetical protein IQ268_09270 [Oculatella sp. LEGE 06141]|uniref:hypothetical protein n=1 Tax=Oculatella sp. LEGE 06141 TaxID=1828648 RepID=UPI00187E2BCB|nr:hypothetical protein [Oculatella sp. LEGE 06141]MBE9178749.1 hypothetical protein [Oculatella sp. LEGE 06141]